MLKIEELGVRDTLVHIETGVEYEIQMFLSDNEILLVGGEIINDLAYFKKKEQSQCAFDDLIDVLSQAVKDKVLFGFVEDASKNIQAFVLDGNNVFLDVNDIEGSISTVKSLYKETFVIECEDDVEKIKASKCIDSVKLTNDVILSRDDLNVILPHYQTKFLLMLLKGATVEQERGRDD